MANLIKAISPGIENIVIVYLLGLVRACLFEPVKVERIGTFHQRINAVGAPIMYRR